MATNTGTQFTRTCKVCISVPWMELQPEDGIGARPHHASRAALEESAKSCGMCRLILRAAISNYTGDAMGRQRKGYWQLFHKVKYQEASTVRDVMYIKDFGSWKPAEESTWPGGFQGGGVLGARGTINSEGEHLESELPQIADLKIDEAPQDMPVWLYANWWASADPKVQSNFRFMGIGARFGKSASHFDAFGSKPGEVHLRGSLIRVCTNDGSSMTRIPGRLRAIGSSSEVAFERLERWLNNCINSHQGCQSIKVDPVLPTRVLDVQTSEQKVSVFQSNGQTSRYITLSHCWGNSSRLLLEKDSLESMQKGILVSDLPRTFRDAIAITRRLGIKYLWIDCLCIVQDDPNDWEREASRMGEVYRNSYLTIAAAGSTNSYSGCFPLRVKDAYVSNAAQSLGYTHLREAKGATSHQFELRSRAQPHLKSYLYMFEEWLPGSSSFQPQKTNIGSFGRYFDPIAEQPLSRRGWTLQERLLSPRIVHYAEDQMYFECDTEMVSEEGFIFKELSYSTGRLLATQRIPFDRHGLAQSEGISFIIGRNLGSIHRGIRWRGGWLSLVEDYMMRKLSVSQDKLTALAGIASVIAKETGDRYYAGLWAFHIVEDLYWRTYPQEELEIPDGKEYVRHGRIIGSVSRPAEYRAPTWSWASIDGPIRYEPLSFSNLVCNILACETTAAGSDIYGRVSAGKIEIAAPMYEVKKHYPKRKWMQHGKPVSINTEDDRGICVGSLHLDLPNDDDWSTFPCYALFLDAGNALILQGPRPKLLTNDVRRVSAEKPDFAKYVQGQAIKIQGAADLKRIGVASFVGPKQSLEEPEEEPRVWDEEVDGKLTLDKVISVQAGGSWGPILNDEPKIWVTIV